MTRFIGIDLGTSGCRAISIDQQGHVLAMHASPYPAALLTTEQDPEQLWQHVKSCLKHLIKQLDHPEIDAIAVDATSGSVMLATRTAKPASSLILYNDKRAVKEASLIANTAPEYSAAQGAASGLAKLLWLRREISDSDHCVLTHQADWINLCLGSTVGVTDSHNALKSGFDPVADGWPDWLQQLHVASNLPRVVTPGTEIGQLSTEVANELGLSNRPLIKAGTTDSTAAFIASGANQTGDAVTVLGSTLVLKLLSEQPVFDPAHGIYSHKLGDLWLTGGASNTGGNVLSYYFSADELDTLSQQIDLSQTPAAYYPLLLAGERFPIADPELAPQLTPRPADNAQFLYDLLSSMAAIEDRGYQLLARLSHTTPTRILTSGGGSKNQIWQTIRQQQFDIPVVIAAQTEAAYGAALLARDGIQPYLR